MKPHTVFVCLIPCFFCFSLLFCSPQLKPGISSSIEKYWADGVSGGVVVCRYASAEDSVEGPLGDISAINIVARERSGREEKIFFKSTEHDGKVMFRLKDGAALYLTFYKLSSDIDNDGFPDEAELADEADRSAFIGWFVRVAESQFLKRNYSWNANERDCAGLIRYAYREALKVHDEQWQKRSGIVVDKNLPDVKRFNYPGVPRLGEKIFKTGKGRADDAKTFGSFADAGTLLRYNVFFVSRKISDARKGDLLFFNLESAESPYHSMIITDTRNDMQLVYHTGRGDIVKRVSLSYLKASGPFAVDESNSRFLGVYRFNILE
jgi:uncharacterized protein